MGKKFKFVTRLRIKRRDKAYEKLVFNEKFVSVAEARIDAANGKKIKKMEFSSKKRLYPLELSATADAVKNKELQERAMTEFKEKQVMPRRAIQQTYLRKVKKRGEKEASAYRDRKLAKLDDAIKQYQAKLDAKYPLGSDSAAPIDAVDRYEIAQREEQAALSAFAAQCEADKNAKIKAISERIEKENVQLRRVFEKYHGLLEDADVREKEPVPSDVILSIRDMHMHFEGVKAVDGLTMDVKKGEIFGLIGPNGAGKTTLFNCITQFHKPTGGRIYYRDRFDNVVSMTDYKCHDVVKTGIARTFQNVELVLYLTVLENLMIGSHTFFASNLFDQFVHTKRLRDEEEVTEARALEVLEKLDLLEYKDAWPQGLPYGILKRIELARTLMTRPRMIILDEPAAGLNDKETEDLADIIKKIRDEYDCTIFLVEHDMNLVMGVCDTVCAISFGKKLAVGTPVEIQGNKLVQEAYLGEMEEEAE